jgi:hypothetical protein
MSVWTMLPVVVSDSVGNLVPTTSLQMTRTKDADTAHRHKPKESVFCFTTGRMNLLRARAKEKTCHNLVGIAIESVQQAAMFTACSPQMPLPPRPTFWSCNDCISTVRIPANHKSLQIPNSFFRAGRPIVWAKSGPNDFALRIYCFRK